MAIAILLSLAVWIVGIILGRRLAWSSNRRRRVGLVILLATGVLLVGIQTWLSEKDHQQAKNATDALIASNVDSQKKLDAVLKLLVDQRKITPEAAKVIGEALAFTEVLDAKKIEGSRGLVSAAGEVIDWLLAHSTTIATVIMAIFTILAWRTYKRIEWWTGSMDSYSNLMLRIEASRGMGMGADKKPVELVWWDPNIGGRHPGVGTHDTPVDLTRIRIFLPRELRQKTLIWKRVVQSTTAALRRTRG